MTLQKKLMKIQILFQKIYTRSKILGEKKVLKNIKKTKLVILRLCNLFGYPVI